MRANSGVTKIQPKEEVASQRGGKYTTTTERIRASEHFVIRTRWYTRYIRKIYANKTSGKRRKKEREKSERKGH